MHASLHPSLCFGWFHSMLCTPFGQHEIILCGRKSYTFVSFVPCPLRSQTWRFMAFHFAHFCCCANQRRPTASAHQHRRFIFGFGLVFSLIWIGVMWTAQFSNRNACAHSFVRFRDFVFVSVRRTRVICCTFTPIRTRFKFTREKQNNKFASSFG